jgi:formylglycine-generating enzyme required for sulfatase activity
MGSPLGERHRLSPEGPMHEVEITKPFYLGVFPVTQGQFHRVRELRPAWFCANGQGSDQVKGLDTATFPIEMVSWNDALDFCRALSQRKAEARAGRRYRLPTEAEWEYACRAGTMTPFHFGMTASLRQANFDGQRPYGAVAEASLQRPSPVGRSLPNAWGLYDMHGNVWEWVADRFARDFYSGRAQRDPTGPKRGDERMVRGGSWNNVGSVCRSATRGWMRASVMDNETGFRVVCEHPAQDG